MAGFDDDDEALAWLGIIGRRMVEYMDRGCKNETAEQRHQYEEDLRVVQAIQMKTVPTKTDDFLDKIEKIVKKAKAAN